MLDFWMQKEALFSTYLNHIIPDFFINQQYQHSLQSFYVQSTILSTLEDANHLPTSGPPLKGKKKLKKTK